MFKRFYKYLDLDSLTRIMQFARPYKKLLIVTLLLTIILGFIAPVRPIIIKIMVDEFIPNKDKQKLLEYSIFLVTPSTWRKPFAILSNLSC